MKYFFTSIVLTANVCFAGLTNIDQQHLKAEFWQRADGKYCVQIVEENGHVFVFDTIQHSDECPCDSTVLLKQFESKR